MKLQCIQIILKAIFRLHNVGNRIVSNINYICDLGKKIVGYCISAHDIWEMNNKLQMLWYFAGILSTSPTKQDFSKIGWPMIMSLLKQCSHGNLGSSHVDQPGPFHKIFLASLVRCINTTTLFQHRLQWCFSCVHCFGFYDSSSPHTNSQTDCITYYLWLDILAPQTLSLSGFFT